MPYSRRIPLIGMSEFIGFAITLKNANSSFAEGELRKSDFPTYLTGIPSEIRICAAFNPSFCFLDKIAKSLNV